ncbi:ATP-binding cassette domain-containing protein [Priestia sp. HNGD-A6]|uniref:ABC transporter ATP-binding protein/permease n=1 Tax=Priestia sp. HNGD-A6 TaxID=3092666 RepID=UPI0038924B4F
MIRISNVSKSYELRKSENISVLKNVNMDFKKGELISILGPSGCGKSTLLNIIGGLDRMDKGDLIVSGTNTKDFKEKDWDRYRKSKIGFIFQNFNLIPHLTALENVEVSMTLTGISKSDRLKRAKELLNKVGLSERSNHRPNELSGGQKQRVAIARALANNPDIILADEPTGALDSRTSQQIIELLKGISSSGKLVIVVTHSQELANHADRVIEMLDGQVLSDTSNMKAEVPNKLNTNDDDLTTKDSTINLSTTLKLAFRNIKQKKWRTMLTAFGASIGIGGIAIMVGLGIGVQNKVTDELEQIAEKNIVTVQGNSGLTKKISKDDIEKIRNITGVASVYPSYNLEGSILTKSDELSVPMLMLQPEKYKGDFNTNQLIKGTYPKDNDKSILISESTAKDIYGDKVKYKDILGKKVKTSIKTLTDSKSHHESVKSTLSISGIVKDGPFGLPFNYIPYKESAKINDKSSNNRNIYSLSVVAKSPKDFSSIQNKIEKMKLYVDSDEEQMKKINTYFKMAQAALGLFAGISLVISSIMIGIVLYISVLERTREIGILKSLGARRKDIRRLFLSEAAVIGFLGGAIGVIGSYLISVLGNEIAKIILKKNYFKLFDLPLTLIVFCIALSIVVSVIAGFIPSNKATKQNPVEALKYE